MKLLERMERLKRTKHILEINFPIVKWEVGIGAVNPT